MIKKIKTGCFILCRTSSSRLPKKALLKVRGKPVIQHIFERARLVSSAEVIVLCTSTDQSDDILETIAKENDIACYRGSLDDVLERLQGAAKKYNISHFAIFSGDNIFCDPALMNMGIEQILKRNLDFINIPDNLVCGGSAYCMARRALEKVCSLKIDNTTEYYPKYFTSNRDMKIENLEVHDAVYYNSNVRLTLDYKEDMSFIKAIFDEFDTDSNSMSLKEILKLINRKPKLAEINFFRDKDWHLNQEPMKC